MRNENGERGAKTAWKASRDKRLKHFSKRLLIVFVEWRRLLEPVQKGYVEVTRVFAKGLCSDVDDARRGAALQGKHTSRRRKEWNEMKRRRKRSRGVERKAKEKPWEKRLEFSWALPSRHLLGRRERFLIFARSVAIKSIELITDIAPGRKAEKTQDTNSGNRKTQRVIGRQARGLLSFPSPRIKYIYI